MLWDIAVEFGETAVRMAARGTGSLFSAPSWGARRGNQLTAIGQAALDMVGRAPSDVRLVRPVSGGSISDARLISQWLSQLLEPFTSGVRLTKPSLLVLDNGLMPASEKELLVQAAINLGASQCGFLSADAAAAAGAGLDIRRPEGIALIDIGAGTMSASLLSFGRTVCTRRLRFGLDRINDDIIHLVREETGLLIGPHTAEDIKIVLASAAPAREVTYIAAGLDMKTGFPGERTISSPLIKKAVNPVIDALVLIIRELISLAPDELSADLIKSGLILTGGGALLSGIDIVLAERCGLACHRPEAPALCTQKGMARILQDEALSEICVRTSIFQ